MLIGGVKMNLASLGQNIRKYRAKKGMRQEDLAEKVGLSSNYIGSLERGEKIPALLTFIEIANALEVSADMLLCDILVSGYHIKNSLLSEKMEKLSSKDKEMIYDVIDTLIKHSIQVIRK